MKNPPKAAYDHILLECEKVTSLIAASRRHLKENRAIDLSALEGRVRKLCQGVGTAPDGSYDPLRETISDILGDLDNLEAEIVARHRQAVAPDKRAGGHKAKQTYSATAND